MRLGMAITHDEIWPSCTRGVRVTPPPAVWNGTKPEHNQGRAWSGVRLRKVDMGYHIVKEGEQALVFSTGGRGTLVIGPRRVSTEREREREGAHGLAVAF